MSRRVTDFCMSQIGRAGRGPADLWVLTCYFNPCKYQSRYQNYLQFAQNLRKQKVQLCTVELGAPPHLPPDSADLYIAIQETDVLWAKERLLQIGLERLPASCRYVVWCDCDILFQTANWAWQTVDALQVHRVIQPFTTCFFLGALETPLHHGMFPPSFSFAKWYSRRQKTISHTADVISNGHPGYVWAARRDVLQRMGFYDKCILGHADVVMAIAFSHNTDRDGPFPETWEPQWSPGWSAALQQDIRLWQARAVDVVQGDLGFLTGNIYHLWHGPRSNRNYHSRGYLLQDFDPNVHLALSAQGTWRWTEAARRTRVDQRCLQYFEQRQEDDRKVK
jgi:hypothetical protein